jgi:microcystin-dependent protein
MAFVFTPTCPGTGPWYIDREDCIGDSLLYINANTGYLDCKIDNIIPAGAILPFYRPTAPTGWLICDGSTIPVQYANLISLVGANTPNLRGMFIRGWSSGTSTTSRDPLSATRALGSSQEDAFESHNHTSTFIRDRSSGATGNAVLGDENYYGTQNVNTNSVGDTETRPVNIALLYCIKT